MRPRLRVACVASQNSKRTLRGLGWTSQQEANRVAEQVHKLEIRRKGYKINEEQKEK